MFHYTLYLKQKKENKAVIEIISELFAYETEEIIEVGNKKAGPLKFENRFLDDYSDFCTEINIYADDINKVMSLGLNNNLLLGMKVSDHIKDEVIVAGLKDHQWFLINKGRIFLVEETEEENYGITLKSDRTEISYQEALEMQSKEL